MPHSRLRAGAWVLYDLANTVYAATLTYLLTPYAKQQLGDLRLFGIVSTISMLCAGLCVPVFGVLIDQNGRTRRYLAIATLACIAAIAGFGADCGGAVLLACFFVANLTYNLGLLFYNALLPAVAAPGREGRLSGLGTGLGYIGTLVVLMTLMPLQVDAAQRFWLAALLFLVTALPCLLLVRDRRGERAVGGGRRIGAAFTQLAATLRELPRHRSLLCFLLANFCLLDVINTAILYFVDFTQSVFAAQLANGDATLLGWSFRGDDGRLALVMLLGVVLNTLAMGFGIVQGIWTDRAPLAVLRTSAIALLLALVGGAGFGGHSLLGYTLTLVTCGAFGLAGVQTAGRKVVLLLAPPDRIGEFFGLYGITVKLSVIGSAVYGFVEYYAGCKPAMLAQGAQLLIALVCLAMVRLPATQQPAR